MIKYRAKVKMKTHTVKRAAGRAKIKTYQQAGAMIYRIARNSVKRRKNPKAHSPPGTPPFTHTGALKRSIRFAATDNDVVVGATLSEIGTVANLHEFGGTPKKKKRKTQFRNNWKLQLGGHGPIEIGPPRWVKRSGNRRVFSRVYFAKLTTANMVAKSKDIAADAEQMLIAERLEDDELIAAVYGNDPKYPPRPFMGPALIKAQPYLPKEWRNSIKNS
jgi:phage gpG-like protein